MVRKLEGGTIKTMKKFYFLLLLLLIPTIVQAKTVTCTSEDNFTIDQNVYDGINVTCSEGEVELFAVTETANEITVPAFFVIL